MKEEIELEISPAKASLFQLTETLFPIDEMVNDFEKNLLACAIPMRYIAIELARIRAKYLNNKNIDSTGYRSKVLGMDFDEEGIKSLFRLWLKNMTTEDKKTLKHRIRFEKMGHQLSIGFGLESTFNINQTTQKTFLSLITQGVNDALFEAHLFKRKTSHEKDKLLPSKEGLSLPDFKYDTHHVAWLQKLGVIDAIKKHFVIVSGENGENESYDIDGIGEALRSITGIGFEHCRKMVESILAPNKSNARNNPLTSKETQKVVAEMAAKYGLK